MSQQELTKRIRANPKFHELKSKRNTFGWLLTIIMLIVYYGYIVIIAFDKSLLAAKLSESGVMTVGIPVGAGIIVFTILITGLYVRRANSEFDALTEQIVQEEMKK
ncbi:MAG TPA: DUF485 domain-containing protein [Azospira sp.]|nr:DUF485 domain-containing protein [Azospira sp.]